MAERMDNEIRHRIDHGLHSEQGDASLWDSISISAFCTDRCNVVEARGYGEPRSGDQIAKYIGRIL